MSTNPPQENSLPDRMRTLAKGGHPRAEDLQQMADDMDNAIATHDMRKMIGAWARARRLWCECTGEPLI